MPKKFVVWHSDWAYPVSSMSGNGAHLKFKVDLPNNDAARKFVKIFLAALAERFNNENIHIDTTLSNASRIIKLEGTMTRKGTEDDDRPWRRATLLMVPKNMEVATPKCIQKAIRVLRSETAAARHPVKTPANNDDLGMPSFTLPETIKSGSRTEVLVKYVASLVARGHKAKKIKRMVEDANAQRCKEPLSDSELKGEVFPAIDRFIKSREVDLANSAMAAAEETVKGIDDATREILIRAAQLTLDEYDARRKYLKKGSSYTSQHLFDRRVKELRESIYDAVGGEEDGSDETQATQIIRIIKERVTFIHDEDKEPYVVTKGHPQRVIIMDKASAHGQLRDYVSAIMYKEHQTGITDDAYSVAHATLRAIAIHDGELCDVFVRVAEANDKHYIDLCNENWDVIELDKSGWRVINPSPVYFRRSDTMRPIPAPVGGGDTDILWKHFNIEPVDRNEFKAMLIYNWRYGVDYPIVKLRGGEGTGKTFIAKGIKTIIDPSKAPTRGKPKEVRDLNVAAANNHILAYENISTLSNEMSDNFCRISTGSGVAERTLYSNFNEVVRAYRRVVILEGIPYFFKQPDIIDRSVYFEIKMLGAAREASSTHTKGFEHDLPYITGALLDLFSETIAALPQANINQPVRMMDFALFGQAMLDALSVNEDFSALLHARQENTRMEALAGSPFITTLLKFMDTISQGKPWMSRTFSHPFIATGAILLKVLTMVPNYTRHFPTSGKGAIEAIHRHEKVLRGLGIKFSKLGHTRRGTAYCLELTPKPGQKTKK